MLFRNDIFIIYYYSLYLFINTGKNHNFKTIIWFFGFFFFTFMHLAITMTSAFSLSFFLDLLISLVSHLFEDSCCLCRTLLLNGIVFSSFLFSSFRQQLNIVGSSFAYVLITQHAIYYYYIHTDYEPKKI